MALVLTQTSLTNDSAPQPQPLQNGSADSQAAGSNFLRFSGGLILPPPEIKGAPPVSRFFFCPLRALYIKFCVSISAVIDKTATFVANSQNPPQFEDKIREGQRSDPKFSFLNPLDPYHAYYRHRLDKISRGESLNDDVPSDTAAVGQNDGGAPGETQDDNADLGNEPPAPEFIMEIPNISPIDL